MDTETPDLPTPFKPSQETLPKLRKPTKDDGFPVHQLIAACPPLDPSTICRNLLQGHHSAHTSVAAELHRHLAGFVSGYLVPHEPDHLFLWQVAVQSETRGRGL